MLFFSNISQSWALLKTFLITHLLSCPSLSGKLGGQDSFESIESFESCDRLTQSWSSQSSFSSLQRVPSYDSFDSEDYPTALHGHKPKGTFKDYVRERSDLSKDKPVIPAAALAGYTGKTSGGHTLFIHIFFPSAMSAMSLIENIPQ